MRCLRCFYISNASHQNNSCWRKLSHTCTLLSLFTLGDSMSDRRRARQNQSRKYWMTWKTGTIFMTGPLLKCWIIDYKKPTSCESWDLQKLFDSSEKVKANFKTEIKVARNERMWSQAWNPGFPSHKNSSTSQPANYHRDSQKQNCSLERQYWGKHLNAHEMISERSICQNRHPMPLLQYKNLKRASSTTGYFFHFFLSLDRFMLEGHPEGSNSSKSPYFRWLIKVFDIFFIKPLHMTYHSYQVPLTSLRYHRMHFHEDFLILPTVYPV